MSALPSSPSSAAETASGPVLDVHIAQGSRPEPSLLASSYLPSSSDTQRPPMVRATPAIDSTVTFSSRISAPPIRVTTGMRYMYRLVSTGPRWLVA